MLKKKKRKEKKKKYNEDSSYVLNEDGAGEKKISLVQSEMIITAKDIFD